MASLTEIRQGIAANLEAGVTGAQISAYVLSNPTTPCLWVRPSTEDLVEYSQAMGDGSQNWHMVIQGYVGAVADIGAQKTLDEWIANTGTNSVKAAVEADPTLGGAAAGCVVQACRAYNKYVLASGGSEVLGAEWTVYVLT